MSKISLDPYAYLVESDRLDEKITDEAMDKMISIPPKQAAKELQDALGKGGRIRIAEIDIEDWLTNLAREYGLGDNYKPLRRFNKFWSWHVKVMKELDKLQGKDSNLYGWYS